MDFRIELVPLAVQDLDRSVGFGGKELGWDVDHDQAVGPGLRFVQVTPPGSAFVRFADLDGNRWALQQVVVPS